MKEAHMNRTNAAVIAVMMGCAAVAAFVAASRSVHLGAAAARANAVPAGQIARRNARLDRIEIALRRALRQRPPKLPRVPTVPPRPVTKPIPATPAAPAAVPIGAPAGAPAVVYVRPAPIVHVIHRHGGEHESERGGDHGGGGGADD
jgi:hypothetical protein